MVGSRAGYRPLYSGVTSARGRERQVAEVEAISPLVVPSGSGGRSACGATWVCRADRDRKRLKRH